MPGPTVQVAPAAANNSLSPADRAQPDRAADEIAAIHGDAQQATINRATRQTKRAAQSHQPNANPVDPEFGLTIGSPPADLDDSIERATAPPRRPCCRSNRIGKRRERRIRRRHMPRESLSQRSRSPRHIPNIAPRRCEAEPSLPHIVARRHRLEQNRSTPVVARKTNRSEREGNGLVIRRQT